ncbi:MAG: bifunctional [glutamate--ammonia ligase]-adenylyl-L-tyrosine phosphorylase/[glutamate--ammonia-ligase] adenylyltransferase [Planctomycetota bacterium]|nr:bifunctional [glutamate--ammonia ligase]-adenylyl-L-tyrosine phosphorylase/[glutamate--ammonia-ligase] adenylyltransferase [Planctomycetota bacterium]
MHLEEFRRFLDNPQSASTVLAAWGVSDIDRGHAAFERMASAGVPFDLLAVMYTQLGEHLPRLSDPDMALNNLDRFIAASRNALSLATLFERDPDALPVLLQIFSTSQYLSDLLITDQEAYDLLRLTEGEPVAREQLQSEISSEVAVLQDERSVMMALRRFKRRETLRISYGDIIRSQRIEMVTKQISFLADAIVDAATQSARRNLEQKRGVPMTRQRQPARFVVLALGKLGGNELNYSSDIDLIFIYDQDGQTDGPRPISNSEFFERLARDLVRLLTESTPLGTVYRVDLRLRPEGQQGPVVTSLDAAMHYYDVLGRTWERQAFVKARPIAGDLALGEEFLRQVEPWIYRRYLSRADITGIRALKRRIEGRTVREGAELTDVKTGHGGIRDVEFVIQFLQLLNGGDLPQLRTQNTLEAIAQLDACGCLTHQERTLLDENYSTLRRIEHRLQIMFDLQTHRLPTVDEELRRVAIRLGYADTPQRPALEAFTADYKRITEVNRKILDHLLHDAFADDDRPEPEVDLVLDPDPPASRISEVLGKYSFNNISEAFHNLMALGQERIRFLSTRRCRHFLAAIAPRLLRAIAATADPDATLVNLSKVSDSLGGKGVLWELFSFNPPSLQMYVELCATSPFLCDILTGNPGMLDELMDSLLLDKLPNLAQLQQELTELTRAAEDIEPILHSFKSAQQLRIGMRDVLGKESIQSINTSLSDLAQTCVNQIAQTEYDKLAARFGEPMVGTGEEVGRPAQFVIIALGKFGGRELNYHSDLDLLFLYDADGSTFHARRTRRSSDTTTNQHFFSELAQRIVKIAGHLGPFGRLYQIDPRLRPTGKSGRLATSLTEFQRYFVEGEGRLWERQALSRARPIHGSAEASNTAMDVIAEVAFGPAWQSGDAAEMRDMRLRLQETASTSNLKRGPGGVVDIEFLVQMLQLRHGQELPAIRQPNTIDAISALHDAGLFSHADFEYFTTSYQVLRSIQGRLRLMNVSALNDLPSSPVELSKLAHLLGYPDKDKLLTDCRQLQTENRKRFDEIFEPEHLAAEVGAERDTGIGEPEPSA